MAKSGKVGGIHVDIQARLDKLDKTLNEAKAKTKRAAADMEKIGKNIQFGAMLAKGLAAMGALEAGIKGLTVGTQLWKGEMTAAAEGLKAMPMGIGPVVTAVDDLLKLWTGVADSIADVNKQTALQEAANKRMQVQLGIKQTLWSKESPLADKAATAGMDKGDAARYTARRGAEKQIAELETLWKRAGGTGPRSRMDAMLQNIAKVRDAELAAITKAEDDKARTLGTREATANKQKLDAAFNRAQQLAGMEASGRAMSLKLAKRDADAEVALIESKYESMIRAAEHAGHEMIAKQLETNRALELRMFAERQTRLDEGRSAKFRQVEAGAFSFAGANAALAPMATPPTRLAGDAMTVLNDIRSNTEQRAARPATALAM